jgi:hypothetical protein
MVVPNRIHQETMMNTTLSTSQTQRAAFELHFRSLYHEGRGYTFPCDAEGHVDLDAMSERLRTNYLYVRALMGRDYSAPAVRTVHTVH